MIIVKNRTLMFSNREQYIGTPYDDSSTIRSFMIKRLSVDGIDIAHLSFRLNLRRMDGSEDSDYLEKNVTDERIVLNWTIDGGMLGEPGTAFISLRGHDATGTVKWSTYMAPVYVGEMVGLPDLDGNKLTELERLEVKFDIIHETEALRVQAELDRVNAEIERENNELKRENKEGEREKAESDRIIAENERKRLEEARILAEENRGNAEIIRKQSEESREKSEQEREVAEEERKANNENVKEIIQNANEVIGRAEGVVEAANAAVGKANTAADIAENVTEEAREATQETQQATLMALEAAGRVDDAIDTANKAADNATTAAEKAYNSAENADIQAEFARNEASSASGAASEARAAARNAEKAADNADEAAESANAAAENANQAAENNNTLPLRVEALESEIAQTKSDLTEKVTRPSTAKVGQILEVLTIDANGKPLTFKAVDKPVGKVTSVNGETGDVTVNPITEEEKAQIVLDVVEAISVQLPDAHVIYGDVDENKVITLQGDLEEDVYTIKFRMEDGTLVDGGTLTLTTEEPATNYFNASTATLNSRLGSGGSPSTFDGMFVTDFIPWEDAMTGKKFIISGLTPCQSSQYSYYGRVVYYDFTKAKVAEQNPNDEQFYTAGITTTYGSYTGGGYVRISLVVKDKVAITSADIANLKITLE